MEQRPWQPVLEGTTGEAVLEAVRAIAAAMAAPSRADSTPSASLAAGDAGEALFFAYLAQAFPGEGHEEVALARLERAIAALAEDKAGPSLCSGFTGVAWATGLSNLSVTLDNSTAQQARLATWSVTLTNGVQAEPVTGVAALRYAGTPE